VSRVARHESEKVKRAVNGTESRIGKRSQAAATRETKRYSASVTSG